MSPLSPRPSRPSIPVPPNLSLRRYPASPPRLTHSEADRLGTRRHVDCNSGTRQPIASRRSQRDQAASLGSVGRIGDDTPSRGGASGQPQSAQVLVPLEHTAPNPAPFRCRTPASRRHSVRIAGVSDYRTSRYPSGTVTTRIRPVPTRSSRTKRPLIQKLSLPMHYETHRRRRRRRDPSRTHPVQ